MKKSILLMGLALLIMTIAGAVTVDRVMITPLNANVFSTLTCRYYGHGGGTLSPEYHFYNGADGVWYNTSSTNTYSTLTNGFNYLCRVKLFNATANSTWVESDNNITIDASCINPYPFFYGFSNASNTTLVPSIKDNFYPQFYGNYSLNLITDGLETTTAFLFIGGGYEENRDAVNRTLEYLMWESGNLLEDLTTSGGFSSDGDDTDEDDSTEYTASWSWAATTEKTGTYPTLTHHVPANVTWRLLSAQYHTCASSGGRIYVDAQHVNGSWIEQYNWIQACGVSYTNNTHSEALPYDIQAFRLRFKGFSPTGSKTFRFRIWSFELYNVSSGSVSGAYTSRPITLISDFTQTEGSLYHFEYLDEETRAAFNFSRGSQLNDSALRIYCNSTVSVINISDNAVVRNYTLGIKQIPRRVETLIEYDGGSDYYRRLTYGQCRDRFQEYDFYVVDAVTNPVMLLTITINDETTRSYWENGEIILERYTDTILQEITSERWQADDTASFYLIPNREYRIRLVGADCSERSIGWITTLSGETSKTLTIQGVTYDTSTAVDLFDNVSYSIYNTTTQICFLYNDSGDETDWVWWAVLNKTDKSVIYSDNTTTQNYLGCWVNPDKENGSYAVQVVFSHPDGSIHNFTLGTVYIAMAIFSSIENIGHGFGLQDETFWLMFSLFTISMVAMMFGARVTGIGCFVIFGFTLFFSIVGWLPIYDAPGRIGTFIMVTLLLIAVFEAYRQSPSG